VAQAVRLEAKEFKCFFSCVFGRLPSWLDKFAKGNTEKYLGDVKCDTKPRGFGGRKVTRKVLHIARLDNRKHSLLPSVREMPTVG